VKRNDYASYSSTVCSAPIAVSPRPHAQNLQAAEPAQAAEDLAERIFNYFAPSPEPILVPRCAGV